MRVRREADEGQPIQSDDLPTDDIVELKEDLPETKDYRHEGNNVDKPDGSFDKLKARLVAGGNMQDRSIYEAKESDISSPTVIQESVMMSAAIAAQDKRNVVTVDITR